MRFSPTAVAATVASAALIVVGVDYAGFASTGDSLLLGHFNEAKATTRLVKHGPGPALRLRSGGNHKPSLAVTSSAKVRRLNADRLDGRSSWALSTHAVSYKAGARHDHFDGFAVWPLPLEPGVYQASFSALVMPDQPAPGTSIDVICGVADLDTLGPNTHVYTAESAGYDGIFPAVMSGAETVRIRASEHPAILCTTEQGGFSLFKPVLSSWTPIGHRKVVTVKPAPSPSPVSARQSLLRGLGGR